MMKPELPEPGFKLDKLLHFLLYPEHRSDGHGGWYDPVADKRGNIKYYSTDLAAAWLVVERAEELLAKTGIPDDERSREKGKFILTGPYLNNGWEAGWLERDGEYHLASAEAATAPMAICLAALRAVAQIGRTYSLPNGTTVTVAPCTYAEPVGSVRLYYRIPLPGGTYLEDYQVSTPAQLQQTEPSVLRFMMEQDVFSIKVRNGVTV